MNMYYTKIKTAEDEGTKLSRLRIVIYRTARGSQSKTIKVLYST